jgi:hypothetical protein
MVAVGVCTRAQVITAYAAHREKVATVVYGLSGRTRTRSTYGGCAPPEVEHGSPDSAADPQASTSLNGGQYSFTQGADRDLQGATADGNSTPVSCAQASSNWF